MLEQQIAFFIKNIRAKTDKGAAPEVSLLKTPRDREVFDHIISKGSRPSSSRSCGPDFKPMTPRPSSPAVSCCFDFAPEGPDGFEVQLRPGSSCGNRASKQSSSHGPGTARSAPDLLSPMQVNLDSSARAYSYTFVLQDSINLHSIEGVAEPLREALRDEKTYFLEQIEFLQVRHHVNTDACFRQ
jgi:hypothetical protein